MTGSILVGKDSVGLNGEKWSRKVAYRCHIAITKDAEDLYSAIVLNLPGAGSSGATESAAVESAKNAVRELVECYIEEGREVPWLMPSEYDAEIPESCHLKWILVDA